MADPLHRQLLSQARRLARLDPLRPKQGNLRRAISTAYYSLFHFLIDQTCRLILGSASDRRALRDVMARAFEHHTMFNACNSFAGSTLPKNVRSRLPATFVVPLELRRVAWVFREAQEKRYLADYDPSYRFRREDALSVIRDVEEAIGLFNAVRGQGGTRFFLACLLTWTTLTGRK